VGTRRQRRVTGTLTAFAHMNLSDGSRPWSFLPHELVSRMRARGWLRRRTGEDGANTETQPAAVKLLLRNLSNSALQSFRNACPAGTGDGDGRRREGRQLSSTGRRFVNRVAQKLFLARTGQGREVGGRGLYEPTTILPRMISATWQ
jgi:hypothetical protein